MVLPDGQLRVFIVDDNNVIASSLAMILRLQGDLDVASFTDPLEALRASHLQSPDVLISDMLMPNLSGMELAIQILEHSPRCKVMLLSGDTLSTAATQPGQAGSHNFEVLLKPVHPADLLNSLRRVIDATPANLSVN